MRHGPEGGHQALFRGHEHLDQGGQEALTREGDLGEGCREESLADRLDFHEPGVPDELSQGPRDVLVLFL